MSQNLMIFVMTASISAIVLTITSTLLAGLALAKVIGMEKSTHKIITQPWSEVPTPNEPDYINKDEGDDIRPPNNHKYEEDEIQDLPPGMKMPKALSLSEQMKKYMYPDIDKEQV